VCDRWDGLIGRKDRRSPPGRQAALGGPHAENTGRRCQSIRPASELAALALLHGPCDFELLAGDLIFRGDFEEQLELADCFVESPLPAEGHGDVVITVDLFRIELEGPFAVSNSAGIVVRLRAEQRQIRFGISKVRIELQCPLQVLRASAS
jgi:hypothetical protein